MVENLRIELTAAERNGPGLLGGVVAITASIRDGVIAVGEEWDSLDEIFGDGCSVHVPPRIWEEILRWYAAYRAEPWVAAGKVAAAHFERELNTP
jgi:hypothetical protein